MSTSHTHARPKGQHGASYHRGEEKPTKPHSQLPTSCGAGGSWVFTGPGQIDPSTSPVPRPAPAGPRRNHRIRKSLRCQTRSEPRRPRSISAPVSSTLPDSSLRSIDVRVPQASTPTVFSGTWLARTEPGHSASHPPSWGSQDRPQRLHAVAQSAPPCRPGQSGPGRQRHLPGCRAPAG